MARLFLRTALGVVIAISAIVTSFAQTNPTPWNLATQGNYSLTQWDATQAALSYPASMAFHVFSEPWEPFGTATLDLSPAGDWTAAYNVTSNSRINGEGLNGVSFFATSASQPLNNCAFVGAAVMALNTVGRSEVVVNWTNRLIANGTRPYVMRLQYRIGTSGAWINALDPNGSFYDFDGTRSTGTIQSFSYTLPTVLENQSTVQLRWLYFQNGSGSNTRPRIALDDLSIVSQPTSGVPFATNLAIRTVSPLSPSQGVPFSVVIRSTDLTGLARPVSSSTVVTLSRTGGTGTLGGTISGVIPAGSSSVVISGVTYNTIETGVSLTATATGLTAATSNTFAVASPATWLLIERTENVANVGTPMTPFVVRAMRSDNVIDPSYSGTVTLTRISGPGSLTGVTSVPAVRGVATFDNVSFSVAGNYVVRVSAPGLPSADLAEIVVSATPNLITDIVPQFVHGRFPLGTCNWSVRPVPNYARVTFTGLNPNSTYRFNVGGANDQNLTSTGPGWNLHWDGRTNTYTFLNSKSLTTDGSYSVFATGPGETSKSIWINLTATTNIAFEQGTNMFWRVSLGDNSGRLIRHYQLAQTSVVLDLGSAPNQGTGIVDTYSHATPRNYIALYDNEAGTGRPLSITTVQPDGAVFVGSTSSQPWYLDIDEDQTAWATIIPNNLPNGVRRIQEHSFLTGAVVGAITSATGIWNNVNTVNPTGGFTAPIYLRTPRVNVLSPAERDTVCGAEEITIRYIARGVSGVRLEYSSTDGVTWEPIATVDFALPGTTPVNATTGEYAYNWIVRGATFNTTYRIRATALDRADVSSTTARFVMALTPVVLEQPVSKDLCLGADYTFVALTTGSVRRYQWLKNGVEIPGANTAVFSIEDAHYTSNGVYTCLVEGYGSCGNVVSEGAHIRVSKPISLSNQTFRAAADLGGNAVLSVEAEGPHEFAYQWYRGQNPLVESSRIRGVTSSRLEIFNVGTADLGNDYWCQVTGTCGTIASRVMRVYSTGIYADASTTDVFSCVGGTVTLDVDAYANPASTKLVLRWLRGGLPLIEGGKYEGTTTASLTINDVAADDAGDYTLEVRVEGNESQSARATIKVGIATAPTISVQPVNADVCEGGTLTMSVGATAQGTMDYQWLLNGVEVAGATSATYTIANFTAARAGAYTCRVSTACGTETSTAATATLLEATKLTTPPPATIDVQIGQELSISLVATGAAPLQYQWIKDDVELAGEVAPTYTKATAEATDAGKYWCRIRSVCGDLISDTTTVTTRPVVSSVEDEQVIGGAIVQRVAPNPVASTATVSVQVLSPARLTMTLIEPTGRVVATIFDADVLPGTFALPVRVDGLANGTYLLSTTFGTEQAVQTISVVK